MSDNDSNTKNNLDKNLTPIQHHVLREKGTEQPFTGKYYQHTDDGIYQCVGCGADLFSSDTKYDSGCGWPSFWGAIGDGKINTVLDKSHGMLRTEIQCANCNGHLGHLFTDGPSDKSGMRYCVNSASLQFKTDK